MDTIRLFGVVSAQIVLCGSFYRSSAQNVGQQTQKYSCMNNPACRKRQGLFLRCYGMCLHFIFCVVGVNVCPSQNNVLDSLNRRVFRLIVSANNSQLTRTDRLRSLCLHCVVHITILLVGGAINNYNLYHRRTFRNEFIYVLNLWFSPFFQYTSNC